MKSLAQLFRQPAKTIAGILLVMLAVATLHICVGQSLTADSTEKKLEYQFTTVALPTTYWNFRINSYGDMTMLSYRNKDVDTWVQEKIAEHPELVETVSSPGLASAYIPALTVDAYHDEVYQRYYNKITHNAGNPVALYLNNSSGRYFTNYSQAMLVVQVESVDEIKENWHTITLHSGERKQAYDHSTATVQVVVEQVVGLDSNFADPTGRTITLTIEEYDKALLEALEPGASYIVYGMNYYDSSSTLSYMAQEMLRFAKLPENAVQAVELHYLTEAEKEAFAVNYPHCQVPAALCGDERLLHTSAQVITSLADVGSWAGVCTVLTNDQGEFALLFTEEMLACANTIVMSAKSSANMPEFNFEDGSLLETREILVDTETLTISWDEYKERYRVPTIARLEGSVEEFLATNKFWSNTLDYLEINLHAFPVLGVEKLDYIPDFARRLARITQGRDFTQEELAGGAKVCIISEQLAQINGLSVGDTIRPQFYNYDYSVPYQQYISKGKGTVMPSAYLFGSTTEFAGEAAEYTIIGLYRQDDAWGDVHENTYAFTPNTIFVPETSVTSDMDYGEQGVFRTVILKNGCIEEFEAVISQHEFEPMYGLEELRDLFVYYDQGYSQVKDSFHNYQELAQQVLVVGIVVYGIVLILFLLLYPGRQGKTLRTMANFGTPRKDKIAHVLVSSLGILLPGTILGAVLGIVLWGVVVGRLLTVSGAMFSLTLDLGTLALIALAQLLLALALTLLLAIPMTKHENLMKRK